MQDSNQSGRKNIFSELSQVEKSLSEDIGGERAKAMLDYFDTVRSVSEAMLSQPLSEGDRHLVMQLIEGFKAAQRIIQHVWETQHSTSLPT